MAATSSSFGSSGSSAYDLSEEKTNGTRLARLLVDGGTHVLRKFLHSVYPPDKLQVVLNNNHAKLKSLRSKGVIFKEQWEMLFPTSGDPPDSETFDITLLHLLLREICHLKPPATEWNKKPADDDDSLEANIARIKYFRNKLCHSVSTGISNAEFEDKWNKVASSLEAIEMSVHRKKIDVLKNDPIDHETRRLLEDQAEMWEKLKEQEKIDTGISDLRSCLPDKIPRVFGRNQEIQKVKEIVESGAVPVILITGGPGFGKTTVAKLVARELATPENEGTVLFCSLLSKTTFNEVAIEMINSCSTTQTQVPENPEQWLKDWSKQIKSQVIFVLDNADGVLEVGDRESFLSILRDVRRLSRQNVAFVITARKPFEDPDLQPNEVRLDPLSTEQARNLLVSRVQLYEQDVSQELCKAERIVELCGCVPLALCIVGSLLSDYTEETLIKNLEKEPLAVLEDDQESVEKAIKTSFDLLTEAGQEAFVLMSTFQGSFSSVAAEAVMKACSIPGIRPISVIRSLKKSSLIEQPSSRRYQMHPLIHSYAKKIGRAKYPELLARGEKLACVHFISRLANNADMYWSKDTCKDSLVSFNEDKYNFEYFLQVYATGREEQDKEIMDGCEIFLESFPQKCMYLEKCLVPRNYADILKKLLNTFDPIIQPVHVVELSCLLGHECRKQDQKKYKDFMEKAEEIHSLNTAAFEPKPLSEVYFHNSYARFLSHNKDPGENKRVEQETEVSLKVCNERLGDFHPETAASLLFSGNVAKRRKQRDVAEQQLRKALDLFQQSLGKHFMTAETLKAIADLYLFLDGETEANLEKCLEYYEAAMEMFEDLGVGGGKEIILTLKNFAICHMKRGNCDEGMTLLTKAEQVAERELEVNHTWKVLIKTDSAILHDKMGNTELAKEMMRTGLLMGKELNLTIDKIGMHIHKFLNRFPDTFPEKEFPRNVLGRTGRAKQSCRKSKAGLP